jgi:Fur family ferric uptake transcriptional regulator
MNIETFIDGLDAFYKRNNLKKTKQRETILRIMFENDNHMTPEELHKAINLISGNKIGIATVYRNLSMLEKEGLVNSMNFGNLKRYELSIKSHHDHMICTDCGKIIEFDDKRLKKLQNNIASKYNFEVAYHIVQLFGICSECKLKKGKLKKGEGIV